MKLNRSLIIVGLMTAFLGTLWLVHLFTPTSSPSALELRPGDPGVVAQGKAVYLEQCAACHGENLEGQPNWRSRGEDGLLPAPPHDVSGHTWHHPDAFLIAFTKYGPAEILGNPNYETAMPRYEDILSDEEIIAALSYIKSKWPIDVQTRHNALNDAYKEQSH